MSTEPLHGEIVIRPLRETDLAEADRIVRIAFGTFIGLPDPSAFMGDADYVRTRWRSASTSAFAAEAGGQFAGSNFAANWGSFGFFGPLSIRPDLWNRGIGQRLVEPVIDCFDRWGIKHAGLYTFAESMKHVGLYQKFGFWPRFLTAIMSKHVQVQPRQSGWSLFTEAAHSGQAGLLKECRDVAGAVYDGLDVTEEIRSVNAQKLGDTVLVWSGTRLAGFAVCHCGAGSEAGSGNCYIKFAAVRPSPSSGRDFDALLAACEQFAGDRASSSVIAGVNTARSEAYRQMLEFGFRTDRQGVAMHKPNEAGFSRPGLYVIDDWR